MQVKLKVLAGSNEGKEIAVNAEKFLIGRADECQLRPKSESVSRRHAAIIQKDGRVLLVDLKSRNGTFVNDKQLSSDKAKILKDGDLLRIGKLEFQIAIEVGIGGIKSLKSKTSKMLLLELHRLQQPTVNLSKSIFRSGSKKQTKFPALQSQQNRKHANSFSTRRRESPMYPPRAPTLPKRKRRTLELRVSVPIKSLLKNSPRATLLHLAIREMQQAKHLRNFLVAVKFICPPTEPLQI